MKMRLRFKMIHVFTMLTMVGCLCAWFLPTMSRRHAVITEITNVDGVLVGKSCRTRIWSDVLGVRSFDEVDGLIFLDGSVSTDLLTELHVLDGLTTIAFFGVELKENDICAIGQLTSLRHLSLSGCSVSNAKLVHLRSLAHLETLDLSGTDITDSELSVLEEMSGLRRVSLYPARGSHGLQRPLLSRTQIDELRRNRPDLVIHWDRL